MMNNKDFLDNIYKKYDNVDTSDKFYRTNVNNKKPKLQYTFIFLFLIVIASSILYGDNFFFNFSSNTEGNVNKNSSTFIEDYNIPSVDMDYKYCKGVGVKISNLYMDENNIYIIFDLKLKKSLLENIHSVEIKDMIITDENSNIIFCRDYETYKNFYNSNNLYSKNLDFNLNNTLTLKFDTKFIEKNENHIKYLYIFTPTDKYPISKDLYINFNNINLHTKTFHTNSNIIPKEGSWKFKINL